MALVPYIPMILQYSEILDYYAVYCALKAVVYNPLLESAVTTYMIITNYNDRDDDGDDNINEDVNDNNNDASGSESYDTIFDSVKIHWSLRGGLGENRNFSADALRYIYTL